MAFLHSIYLNAGDKEFKHFLLIINDLIGNVDNTTISELNTTLGIIFYKGHSGDVARIFR